MIIGFIEKAVDGGPEFLDGSKDAALETPFGEFGEDTFDSIEPR